MQVHRQLHTLGVVEVVAVAYFRSAGNFQSWAKQIYTGTYLQTPTPACEQAVYVGLCGSIFVFQFFCPDVSGPTGNHLGPKKNKKKTIHYAENPQYRSPILAKISTLSRALFQTFYRLNVFCRTCVQIQYLNFFQR